MKNIDKILFLPLFAALAISCSSPTSLQTSEYDDVYYSKKDKTIITDNAPLAAESSQQAPQATSGDDRVANPEYSPKSSGGAADYTANTGTDYYSPGHYDEDDYYYASRIRRFNAPYRGLSYYDFAYTDYYWYNRDPFYYGRSIYHDPYFYPCYTCYGYPPYYGGLTIIINRPYYSRWGWGNPYGYYGGLSRGYYGGGYGSYYGNSGWYRNDTNISRNVQYGPRRDRSAVPAGNDNSNAPNRPRRDMSDNVSGGGGVVRPDAGDLRPTRSTRGRRAADNNEGSISQPEESRTGTRGRIDRSNDAVPTDRTLEPANRRSSRSRAEELETVPIPREERVNQPRSTEESPVPRGRDRRNFEPRSSEDQPIYNRPRQEQQRPEPSYQPRQRSQEQRSEPTFERSRPVYEAPQRQERYSPPSSPSNNTPSYNTPSRSSGGGGSSNDGGGGGGRSSRGRGN
jgi:hypothetical protein